MARRRNLPEAEVSRFIVARNQRLRAIAEGTLPKTVAEMAAEFGVSTKYLSRLAGKRGLPRPNAGYVNRARAEAARAQGLPPCGETRWTAERRDEFMRLYEDPCLSREMLCRHLRITASSFAGVKRRLGLTGKMPAPKSQPKPRAVPAARQAADVLLCAGHGAADLLC